MFVRHRSSISMDLGKLREGCGHNGINLVHPPDTLRGHETVILIANRVNTLRQTIELLDVIADGMFEREAASG